MSNFTHMNMKCCFIEHICTSVVHNLCVRELIFETFKPKIIRNMKSKYSHGIYVVINR